ncbi:Aux/IAA-ARF-dimerization [Artemisia annua]|uniref:Auxin-responsive protein n=1 Tax=Artemisia annua TaxID=35608 RepID=A0A2U1NIX2_ARTAN|nr:Aux/IAA-ARF-dimerization [Artemisia annua]
MSNVTRETTADREDSNDDYDEMELTLALPGESRERKLGTKRQFSDVVYSKPSDSECSESDSRKHVSKERVVGWPPVRSYRKNTTKSSCKYVKVAVDGAPYLRKVNLESYTSYEQLLCAFEDMFSCFTILNEKMTDDHVNRSEHVPTYEDKDGDWMLVGDVPWKMFVETCKRIRLMKNSEAINQLDPRTLLKSSNNKSRFISVKRCRKHQKDKRCHAIKMCKTVRRNVAARMPASTHCFAVAAAPRDVKDVWTVIVAAASSPIPLMLEIAVRTILAVVSTTRNEIATSSTDCIYY